MKNDTNHKKIKVLNLKGSPYQIGYQHGQAYSEAIQMFAEERVQLSMSNKWTGHSLSREQVLALGEACVAEHERYSPALMEELRGMAAATQLSLSELIIVNGFTDFIDLVYQAGQPPPEPPHAVDDCTAFIVPNQATTDNYGYYGQTWDMHATATPYVRLLRCLPVGEPAALVFTITGCVGMIGMNEAGIAVGINNLLGADGQVGVTWPFVIRQILRQTTIEAAMRCLTEAKLAGAHNYLLFDSHGQGFNVEAMPSRTHITPLADEACLVHTNHCLQPETRAVERARLPESQASSEARLARAQQLLQKQPLDVTTLMELTRDAAAICVTSTSPLFIESCGAAIMQPATGKFWAVWGLPSENEYQSFSVRN